MAMAGNSCRTRTTASAATPSSGAASSTACAVKISTPSSMRTACRRRGRSPTRRSCRTTTGRSGCIRCTARRGPTPPSRRGDRFRIRRSPRAADGGDRRAPEAPGAASLSAAARLCATEVRALPDLQLVSVQAAREERRRRLLRARGGAPADGHALDQRLRSPPAHRPGRPDRGIGGGGAKRRDAFGSARRSWSSRAGR